MNIHENAGLTFARRLEMAQEATERNCHPAHGTYQPCVNGSVAFPVGTPPSTSPRSTIGSVTTIGPPAPWHRSSRAHVATSLIGNNQLMLHIQEIITIVAHEIRTGYHY